MLKLNVWTSSLNGNRPVMGYFRGGGFSFGSSYELASHDGAQMVRHHDVVQVSVNDRLNVRDLLDPTDARYKGAELSFRKGQQATITIEYFQGDGNRSLRFGWRRPGELNDASNATQALDTSVSTYLPKGADWFDFWSNQRFSGGQWVKRDAPLDIVPLYVRADSIVPMGPEVQYATARPKAPYELRIYPGANARFTIYEDDNETYNYEKGERATYDLMWNDEARTLTIGARHGVFPGTIKTRELDFVLVSALQQSGLTPARAAKRIRYTGRRAIVRF